MGILKESMATVSIFRNLLRLRKARINLKALLYRVDLKLLERYIGRLHNSRLAWIDFERQNQV